MAPEMGPKSFGASEKQVATQKRFSRSATVAFFCLFVTIGSFDFPSVS